MGVGMRARLEQLERRAADRSDACPRCGANWEGSVVLALHPNGTVEPRCVVCGHGRPRPAGAVKAYSLNLFNPDGGGLDL